MLENQAAIEKEYAKDLEITDAVCP